MTSIFEPQTLATSVDSAAASLADRLSLSLVAVRSRAGGGSGTIWRDDGLIVTNHHVVPADEAEVVLANNRVFPATVVDRDPGFDLALLQIEALALPAVEPGDSSLLRVGEMVFALGNPWGERGCLTAGIVLAVRATANQDSLVLTDVIRADVRLAPGNSGGPLVTARGRVVGINAMIAGGVAVAVPSNTVADFAARAASGRPGFLGVHLQPVPVRDAIAASYALPESAALMLTGVDPGSPAETAGLIPGDIILAVDGTHRGIDAVGRRFLRMRAGRPLRLVLLRGGVACEAEATPSPRI